MLQSTHVIPGLVLREHRFTLPLDYANPGATIEVFAREVIAPGKQEAKQPYLVFLQGGPGSGSPRPMGNSGWIKRALQDYRVLLLDQRGTSLSTPITAQTLNGARTNSTPIAGQPNHLGQPLAACSRTPQMNLPAD